MYICAERKDTRRETKHARYDEHENGQIDPETDTILTEADEHASSVTKAYKGYRNYEGHGSLLTTDRGSNLPPEVTLSHESARHGQNIVKVLESIQHTYGSHETKRQ